MIIKITNGHYFERIPSVKMVRKAYEEVYGYNLGLKTALDMVKDGIEYEIPYDPQGLDFIEKLKNYGFTLVIYNDKVNELPIKYTKEMVIERLFKKFMDTENTDFLHLALEIKNNF